MLDSHEHLHVPVFPLPRVVFFPGTTLPLHFFEPRYRAMMDHVAEAGVTHMAVVLLAPGWEAEYEGRPAIHRVAGLGRIVEHERLPNGTHNAILRGVARVALEEHPSVEMPFRMATARPVEGHGVPSAEALAGLVSASQAVAVEVRKQHPAFELDVAWTGDPGELTDQLADQLVADIPTRQRLLETLDVRERVECATAAISELLAIFRGSRPPPFTAGN